MAVKLRLKRMGSKKRPFYRLIAADSRMPRDGRFIETLGYYNPLPNPADIRVNEDSVFKWLERGAVPTTSAASLLRQVGCLQKWQLKRQGFTGDALDNRVEAIKAQRATTLARREQKKRGELSSKAKAKAAADAEKPAEAAAAPADTAGAEAPEQPAETAGEAPAPAAEAPEKSAEPQAAPQEPAGDKPDAEDSAGERTES